MSTTPVDYDLTMSITSVAVRPLATPAPVATAGPRPTVEATAPAPLAEACESFTRAAFSPSAPPRPPQSSPSVPSSDDPEVLWGGTGHSMVNREASRDLPSDMPDFFRLAGDSLEALASQPDRWKLRGLPTLDVMNRPDHYINFEHLGGRELPGDRYAYVGMIAGEHLQTGDTPSWSVGLLPYAISEYTEKLMAEFALYRHEVANRGSETALARQLASNAVYTAGILGHFIADASQPLHVTSHHDGWNPQVEPNPDGYTTQRGIHSRFETRFVEAAVRPRDVAARLQPAQLLQGTPLHLADAFCRQTNQQVRPLYTLDRDHKLDPQTPSDEGRTFAVGCVASGAQFLRDIWYTAWTRSEALAADVPEPEGLQGAIIAR